MADLSSSQNMTRNMSTTSNPIFVVIEKLVLGIMKRFRFPEPARVISLDPDKMMVRCELLYRRANVQGTGEQPDSQYRVTKWLKVHSIFASNDEGFCAMPNIGDYGVVYFRAGDQAGGYFLGEHWGEVSLTPRVHNILIKAAQLLIKRNGSWMLINTDGDIENWHVNENSTLISRGFEIFDTPEGQSVDLQRWCNQHTRPFEFKLATWIRTRSRLCAGTPHPEWHVKGDEQRIQIKRRRITLVDPYGNPGCPYDAPANPAGNRGTTGGFQLGNIVFENYVSDGAYELIEEVVDKTRLTNDTITSNVIMELNRHVRKYDVGYGSSLLMSPVFCKEEYHETYKINWIKLYNKLTIDYTKTTEVESFTRKEMWASDNYYIKYVSCTDTGVEMDEYSAKDPGMLKYKERVNEFRYEEAEFDVLAVTDDTVEAQIERNGSPLVYNHHWQEERWYHQNNGYTYIPGVGWTNYYDNGYNGTQYSSDNGTYQPGEYRGPSADDGDGNFVDPGGNGDFVLPEDDVSAPGKADPSDETTPQPHNPNEPGMNPSEP